MTWVRCAALLCLLGGIAWLVQREQTEGRLRGIDESFLDFLVANSREQFEQPSDTIPSSHPVVKVVLNRSDALEYSSWPPQPLDWQMVLKSLQAFDPEVLIVTTPLSWGHPPPDFVPALADALLPFPSVVLAAEGMTVEGNADNEGAPAFLGDLQDRLPRFQRTTGPEATAIPLQAIVTPPEEMLRQSGEIGLTVPLSTSTQIPAVLRSNTLWLPTLPIQVLSRHSRTPYTKTRIRLGTGAGIYMNQGLYIPLTNDGTLSELADTSVPEVNALNLITDGFAEMLEESDKAALGSGKLVFVGIRDDAEEASAIDRHASIIASALSTPRINALSLRGTWIVWALAAGIAFWIGMRHSGSRALWKGGMMMFLVFALGFVAFQSSFWWCPPSTPLALLVGGTLFGLIFGPRPRETNDSQDEPSTVESEIRST